MARSKPEWRQCAPVLLGVILTGLVIGVAVAIFDAGGASTVSRFAGDWVIDYRGRSHGAISLLSNGRIDSHDNFTGRWIEQGGIVQLQFWAKPTTRLGRLSPKYLFQRVDECMLGARLDAGGEEEVLRNENVSMRRVPKP